MRQTKASVFFIRGKHTDNNTINPTPIGIVDTVSVALESTRRVRVFELDGGQMVLFKFDTGAPFVGVNAPAGQGACNNGKSAARP